MTDESLGVGGTNLLLSTIEKQEPWSDIPILLFPSSDVVGGRLISALGSLANATILERPIRTSILISAVRSALRSRRRQHEMRDLLLRLREADRQKDLFLATLSHELRTPLTSIVGWSKILMENENVEPAMRARALETIYRNAQAQAHLIEDILSISRIVAGKLAIDRQNINFSEIVMAAVDSIRPAAAAKNIQLNPSIVPTAFITGDPVRLQEVVLNVLSNAVKFTPSGGRIDLELTLDDQNALLRVTDNGIGITAEVLPHIFEHFRQADSSDTRAAGGLGLGLAIAKNLVHLHGGSVRATSEGRGKGTSMFIEIPRQRAGAAVPPLQPDLRLNPIERTPLTGHSVMLVEDDKDSRELLGHLLRDSGATVLMAESAPQAFELFRTSKPDIIVSDIGLPGENGYDLLARIRSEELPSIAITPAVALTGYADTETQEKALAAGFQVHLAKPVQPERLLTALVALLQ